MLELERMLLDMLEAERLLALELAELGPATQERIILILCEPIINFLLGIGSNAASRLACILSKSKN